MFTTCEQPVYIPAGGGDPSRAPASHTVSHTGRVNSKGSRTTPARTHARGTKPAEKFRRWRKAKFGDECIDPVAVAVDDAVKAFSRRDPEQDRRVWLSVANRIGVESFLDKMDEMRAIVKSYAESGTPLANPAAMFQGLLNGRTKHGKQIRVASCELRVEGFTQHSTAPKARLNPQPSPRAPREGGAA